MIVHGPDGQTFEKTLDLFGGTSDNKEENEAFKKFSAQYKSRKVKIEPAVNGIVHAYIEEE